MKTQNFTGYKVPKTLDYSKIEVREDLKCIPQTLDLKNNYYIFYNNNIGNYAIPQNCNNKNVQELKDLKKFLTYLKSPMTKEEIMNEVFNLMHTTIEEDLLARNYEKAKRKEINYDKLQKSGKFIIKRELQHS